MQSVRAHLALPHMLCGPLQYKVSMHICAVLDLPSNACLTACLATKPTCRWVWARQWSCWRACWPTPSPPRPPPQHSSPAPAGTKDTPLLMPLGSRVLHPLAPPPTTQARPWQQQGTLHCSCFAFPGSLTLFIRHLPRRYVMIGDAQKLFRKLG